MSYCAAYLPCEVNRTPWDSISRCYLWPWPCWPWGGKTFESQGGKSRSGAVFLEKQDSQMGTAYIPSCQGLWGLSSTPGRARHVIIWPLMMRSWESHITIPTWASSSEKWEGCIHSVKGDHSPLIGFYCKSLDKQLTSLTLFPYLQTGIIISTLTF